MKKPATGNKRSTRKRDDGASGPGKDEGIKRRAPGEGAGQDHPLGNAHGRTIHNGSAGAFDATEHSHDEEDEDQDSDDFAMDR